MVMAVDPYQFSRFPLLDTFAAVYGLHVIVVAALAALFSLWRHPSSPIPVLIFAAPGFVLQCCILFWRAPVFIASTLRYWRHAHKAPQHAFSSPDIDVNYVALSVLEDLLGDYGYMFNGITFVIFVYAGWRVWTMRSAGAPVGIPTQTVILLGVLTASYTVTLGRLWEMHSFFT